MADDQKLNELLRVVQQLVSQQKETAAKVLMLESAAIDNTNALIAIREMIEDTRYKQ